MTDDQWERYDQFLGFEQVLVTQLVAAGFSQNQALRYIGLAKSTWQYRHTPRPRTPDPIPQSQRRNDIALDEREKAIITDRIKDRGIGETINQVYYRWLSAGDPVASQSSYYRIARSIGQVDSTTTRKQARRHQSSATKPPQLHAVYPGQVLVWDITFLLGYFAGTLYALHLVMDLYSRKIVGWSVQAAENGAVAVQLMQDTVDAMPATVEIVHSDNGKAMTSTRMRHFLAARGITASTSRPHVSNDNPHIESLFSTLKGQVVYPGTFDDIVDATDWVTGFVGYYNTVRYHPGLNNFTPQEVFDGSWELAWVERQLAQDKLVAVNPKRFHCRPRAAQPPVDVRFNLTNTPGKPAKQKLGPVVLAGK